MLDQTQYDNLTYINVWFYCSKGIKLHVFKLSQNNVQCLFYKVGLHVHTESAFICLILI